MENGSSGEININPSQDEYHVGIGDDQVSTNVIRRHAPPKLDVSNDATTQRDGTSYMTDTSQVTNLLRLQLHFSSSVHRLQE
jgi:hypothetical protein